MFNDLMKRWFGLLAVMQLLESAFKKETVGLVTREQFVEKVRVVFCRITAVSSKSNLENASSICLEIMDQSVEI